MQVILLEKIDNLGQLGELVDVKPGFARNFLLPQQKAKMATADNLAEFEKMRADLEARQAKALEDAKQRAAALEDKTFVVQANAGSEGKLFGSVGTDAIAEAISDQAGVSVERREVRLPDGPLRVVGEHEVSVHLHSDVDIDITVAVEAVEE